MADNSNHPDMLFDSQPDSSGFSNDDFEKVDAPGHDDGTAASGAYDVDQDAEISTTDADVAGEEEAEADRFAMGSQDVIANNTSDPLISWGDEDTQVQPSAPVPESNDNDPLLNFDEPTGDDYMQSFKPSIPPTSTTPEPNFSSSSNPPPSSFDEFIEPKTEEQSERVKEQSNQVSDSDQTTVEAAEGSWLKGVDPREDDVGDALSQALIDLIYWRDVKTTGLVFGAMLVVLLSLAIFSLLSVVAYLSLAVMTVTFSFTVYKKIMGAVQKSNDGHPFKQLISMDITLSEDKLKSVIQSFLKNANCTISELRRLFLIEDMVDSIKGCHPSLPWFCPSITEIREAIIKFGLLLWVLTYIGAWFNGMTLVILVVISIFTLPKVYETYKVQIDNYIGLAKAQIDNVMNIVQSKLPFLKKKEKAQ